MRWSTPSVPASTPSTRLGHDEGSRVRHRYPPVRHRRMEARERGRVGTRVRATQASAAAGARRTGARARRRRRRGSRSARSRSTRRRTNKRTATRSWPAARRGGGASGGPTSCSTRRRGGSRRRRTGLCAWRARRRSSCPRRRRRPRRCWTGSRATRPSRTPGPVGAGGGGGFCDVLCFEYEVFFCYFTRTRRPRQSIKAASRRWRGGGRTNLGEEIYASEGGGTRI